MSCNKKHDVEPLIRYVLGSDVKAPILSMKGDDNDALVDKKGGPENLLDFAREADIVVTCLTLNHETVIAMPSIFCLSSSTCYNTFITSLSNSQIRIWLIQLLGRHSEPEIPLVNETGLLSITSVIFFYQLP